MPLLLALSVAILGVPPVVAQDDIPEVVLELLDRAARAQERGRADDAEAAYREAIQLAPKVVQAYAGLGALLYQQGQAQKALEVFNAGLQQAPEDRDLRYNAAVLSLGLDQPQEALGHVERALASHPRDAQLYLFQGSVLRRLERADDALTALQRAAELAPRDPRVLYALGNAYHEQGQLAASVDSYRQAIDRDAGFLRAHYNLGAVLVELGRYEEAEQAYRVALAPIDAALQAGEEVDPVHARAYRNLGASHFQRQQWRAAMTAYSKAVRLDPQDASGQYHLGYAYFELGDDDAAASTYLQALRLDPTLPLAHLHLARIARRQGEPDEALRRAQEGLQYLDGVDQVAAYRLIAEVETEQGRPRAAEPAWRQIVAARPEDVSALLALGRLLRRDGRVQEASEFIERAFEQAPSEPAAALELASLARLQADPKAEEAIYRRVLAGQGSTQALLPVRLNLALVLLQQQRGNEAREELESLMPSLQAAESATEPASGLDAATRHALVTTYALLLAQGGELASASRQLEQVLSRDAAYAPAVLASAVLEALSGRTDAAVARLEALRTASGTRTDVDLAALSGGNLGQLLWLGGTREEQPRALDALTEAVETFPTWPGPRLALAEVWARQGDLERAARELQTLAENCGASSANPVAAAGPERVQLLLAADGQARVQLCERRARVLGMVRTAQALSALGDDAGRAAQLAEQALRLPLDASDQARAHFVRGTARLLAGADARTDLTAAIDGDLDASLMPLAHNNLGVALRRAGDVEGASRRFEAARRSAPGLGAATLNLGIVREQSGDSASALELYRAYVASGGGRSEVADWVRGLQRFLP